MAERQIVAMGGRSEPLETFLLEVAPGPRVCFLPTAQGDDAWAIVLFYEQQVGAAPRALEKTPARPVAFPASNPRIRK